jgi:hypothetical protein
MGVPDSSAMRGAWRARLSMMGGHTPGNKPIKGCNRIPYQRKTGEAEWTITGPSGGTGIAVSLQESKVLDLTIWRLLLTFDAAHQLDIPQTMISIWKELQARSPDPQAVEFHTSDVAQVTVTWPERVSDASI